MQRHNFYLSEQLVVLALADDEKTKMKMLQQLVGFAIPDQFKMGKPELHIISVNGAAGDNWSTELAHLESG
jgi:hypothetical protein